MFKSWRTLRIITSTLLFIVLATVSLGRDPLPADAATTFISHKSGPGIDATTSRASAENDGSDLLQFTSVGHVLGFDNNGVMIVSADHMLKTEFINANPVKPQSDSEGEGSRDFGKVTYNGLWNGVDLVYEARPGSILKSTYYVEADGMADPVSNIRLRYNRPVSLDAGGNLVTLFDNGSITESKPSAWQDINGEKRAVTSGYRIYSENEVGLTVADYVPGIPLVIDPALAWNTFLGGNLYDQANAITVDGSGNVYVTGYSDTTWGTPLRAHGGGGYDAFAAKLTANGVLTWNTFLGGAGSEKGNGIAVDGSGNVYVAGASTATWQGGSAPVRLHDGGSDDAFAAKLTTNGALTWNTFLGGAGSEKGNGIAVDGSGNVYVTGYTNADWGTPLRAYDGGSYDAFAAKLTTNGGLTWNTFLGGAGIDVGNGIAVDGSGNVYVTGYSAATWQGGSAPVRLHGGSYDAFAAKLTTNGGLTWNTFLGGAGIDVGNGIAVDGSGNVYVTGYSAATWQGGSAPVRLHDGGSDDAFAAKLDHDGGLTWNTFLGGAGIDDGNGIAVDGSGNVYITGSSAATWQGGSAPVRLHDGGSTDAFAAKLDHDGGLTWNTFLGGADFDDGNGIAVDGSGKVYVTGSSDATWQGGSAPVRLHDGGSADAFAAEIAGPEIGIEGNTVGITCGDATPSLVDHTNFGSAAVAGVTIDRTFTIKNTGGDTLNLTDTPIVKITGSTDFSVKTQPNSASILAGGSKTFVIHFDPSSAATLTAVVSIANDDTDENPYTLSIQGTGTAGGGGGESTVGGEFTPIKRMVLIIPLAGLALAVIGGPFLVLYRRRRKGS